MLDPDTLEDVGNLVGAVYSDLEAEMCDILVKAMLENDVGFWKSQAALAMLAQAQVPQLRMVLERYKGKISKATYQEVEEALTRSDDEDLSRLQDYLGYEIPRVSTVQITNAAQKIGEMLERDNLDMLTGAKQALYREATVAIAQVTGGLKSPHEATWDATRRLARNGISVVQYKDPTTGKQTVRNKVDVAVRRHVRSQMAQAAAERTMQVCESTGCGFVEVSSHVGARPSHQDWEGRVYSLNGRVTVDGVTYEDFGESTGYYGEGDHGALGDRLQGVNCRHHFGPWFPGMPRAYHPNPKHPSGKSNDEIYKLTQKQRRMERNLRDTKRELSAALENYKHDPNEKTQLAVNQLKAQLKSQNDKLKAFLDENRGVLTRQPARESVGNMPKVKVPTEPKMSAGPSNTTWPSHGIMLRRSQYVELRDYAVERGVVLNGFRRSDADPDAIRMAVDAIHKVISNRPELTDGSGGSITLTQMPMHSADFAQVPLDASGTPMWGTVALNAAAMRDLEVFRTEYERSAESGFFVRGTSAESVLYHELGHLFQHVHGLDARGVAEAALGIQGSDINDYLEANLSIYAGDGYNLNELISEVFSAVYAGVDNDTARRIARGCGLL